MLVLAAAPQLGGVNDCRRLRRSTGRLQSTTWRAREGLRAMVLIPNQTTDGWSYRSALGQAPLVTR